MLREILSDLTSLFFFFFLPLKHIVSSLWPGDSSRMPWNPSYLFVRMPNLLCRLKYVNIKMWAPCAFIILWNIGSVPGTWRPGHISVRRLVPAPPARILLHAHSEYLHSREGSWFFSPLPLKHQRLLTHSLRFFLFLQKKKRPCRLPKERSHLSSLPLAETRFRGGSKTNA